MNKKGFTLIELLTVIMILGILTTIAVPQVTGYIQKSKNNAFVVFANSCVDSVSASIANDVFDAPREINDVTIINLDMIELDPPISMSPYGYSWVIPKSYVAVVNVGTVESPEYNYYFAAQDDHRNAIPLSKIENITEKTITDSARNTMEVTVQSLAGNISGNSSTRGIISGLQNPVDTNGKVLDWNAKVYTNQQ